MCGRWDRCFEIVRRNFDGLGPCEFFRVCGFCGAAAVAGAVLFHNQCVWGFALKIKQEVENTVNVIRCKNDVYSQSMQTKYKLGAPR